jgi:hypothetical protein
MRSLVPARGVKLHRSWTEVYRREDPIPPGGAAADDWKGGYPLLATSTLYRIRGAHEALIRAP